MTKSNKDRVTRDSFYRLFRSGIEKGYVELMISTDLSTDGLDKFSKPPTSSVVTTLKDKTLPFFKIEDRVNIKFLTTQWTRIWTFHEQAKVYNVEIRFREISPINIFCKELRQLRNPLLLERGSNSMERNFLQNGKKRKRPLRIT